jgi:hypothetical protein
VFVFEDGDGDEREDAGEEGGKVEGEKVFLFVFSFFLLFSLGQRGSEKRAGAVSRGYGEV